MKITPIRTGLVGVRSANIEDVISQAVAAVPENSVLAVTSKIVSLCEGSVAAREGMDRDGLIEREAGLYLPKDQNRYGVYLTVKNGALIPNAGVDESNSGGEHYILWPRDPQASAERCWRFVRERYRVENVGVILTDSTDTPLKWGVTGISIAHCGFEAVSSRVGKGDLYGRSLEMTKINVADALAAAAVLCMGEADERTPLALLEELPFVRFRRRPPTPEELASRRIDMSEDIFGPLLTSADWKRGGAGEI